ncbi:MAG: MerC domain-containing protein [Bacteroidota bacterium]
MITTINKKPDELGMLSSILCIIHCLATPILLTILPISAAVQGQNWWGWLDIFFLIFSSVAVILAVRRSPKAWIRVSMIISLLMLCFFIVNERFGSIEFPFDMVYLPAFALVILHVLNRKHHRHTVTG